MSTRIYFCFKCGFTARWNKTKAESTFWFQSEGKTNDENETDGQLGAYVSCKDRDVSQSDWSWNPDLWQAARGLG